MFRQFCVKTSGFCLHSRRILLYSSLFENYVDERQGWPVWIIKARRSSLLSKSMRPAIPFSFTFLGTRKGSAPIKNSENSSAITPCLDLINIAPLDDLHQPTGVIQEAQKLAADAFGADYTFFSVQGTSGAIMTMILSVCSPGDKIIVPRNIHKSVMSAIIFAGAKPVFFSPAQDPNLGIDHGITTSSVRRALQRHPDAKAVVVINPTYFGVCANLKEIVDLAHSFHVPVLVDEAHGVHIHFHEKLPMSAMQAGADMAATSVHKLGGR